MRLTSEQKQAVEHPGNVLLNACPGSGKTRAIVAKAIRCQEQAKKSGRGVLCITYTRSATFEIESRLRVLGQGESRTCSVSTIHAFCLSDILSKYHWMVPEYSNGYEIITPESEVYQEIAAEVGRDLGIGTWQKIREQFEHIKRTASGDPICNYPLTESAVQEFWNRLEQAGFIDFPSILYFAYKILASNPWVARGIACRYRWILVDEFQDTSEIQVEILRIIASFQKTELFLVGDPRQSIYRFAGARPELFQDFAQDFDAETEFKLTKNFRSSPPIIRHADLLLPGPSPMVAAEENEDCSEEPIEGYFDSNTDAVLQAFIPKLEELKIPLGKAAILAPSWHPLFHIGRDLMSRGVSVSGPGSRPYKRLHQFASIAEELCNYLTSRESEHLLSLEKALRGFLAESGNSEPSQDNHMEIRRCLFRIIRSADRLMHRFSSADQWLPAAANETAQILISHELLHENEAQTLTASAGEILDEMALRKIDPSKFSIRDLGLLAQRNASLQLMNMHRSKGKEFDAVALVGINERAIPSKYDRTAEDIREKRRLFYVAITRAKRFLMYVVPTGNRPSRFLTEIYDQLEQ